MITLIFFVVLFVVIHRATPPETRIRVLRAIVAEAHRLKEYGRAEREAFAAALRARTPHIFVTPAIVLLNILLFVKSHVGAGDLVAWGASVGPRTTNGEWWRLATAMFVHDGFLSLAINMAALLQAGALLERLAGPLAFGAVYVAAGLLSAVVGLSTSPLAVSGGASGAVSGLFGLAAVALVCGALPRCSLRVPSVAIKRLVPIAAIFAVYNLTDSGVGAAAELAGFFTGVAFGAISARGIGECAPAPRLVGGAAAAALSVAVVAAIPQRGIADVRPELQRLAAVEERTAHAYGTAVDQFGKGRMTADDLTKLIDRTILPELRAADARIDALQHIAKEDEPRIADARRYLQLRSDSWRLRAESVRTASSPVPPTRARAEARHRSMNMLRGKAEAAERTALEALGRAAS